MHGQSSYWSLHARCTIRLVTELRCFRGGSLHEGMFHDPLRYCRLPLSPLKVGGTRFTPRCLSNRCLPGCRFPGEQTFVCGMLGKAQASFAAMTHLPHACVGGQPASSVCRNFIRFSVSAPCCRAMADQGVSLLRKRP